MPFTPIYLDHHSTTPCDPRVVERMLPYFTETFGNPAAITHEYGRRAATALEEARTAAADFLRARPNEIFFTAGATESNNLAIFGIMREAGDHMITSEIEHKSILAPAARLEAAGFEVTRLRPDAEGFISPAELAAAIRENTRLVSIMAANGEIGTLQPLSELAAVCREANVPFHTDATQAVGKVPVDVSEIECDLLSLSAHKLYGPKGIGALFVRRGVRFDSPMRGGGQEKNVRPGTVNVPGAVGLAAALEFRAREMATEAIHLTELRNRLWEHIVSSIPQTSVYGPRGLRLPGNLNVSFDRVEAEPLMHSMRRFSLSSGSACSSGDREPSHVLRAIGVSDTRAMESVRIGLGASTTQEDVDLLADDLELSVGSLRQIAGVR
ncbi:MAG TPA: cysteine desulfurase family protein [Thermoanaerobaculia bacterium]|nr:cysteine desulfurase family protein [Thermoanaerobaculia bacterium]